MEQLLLCVHSYTTVCTRGVGGADSQPSLRMKTASVAKSSCITPRQYCCFLLVMSIVALARRVRVHPSLQRAESHLEIVSPQGHATKI